MRRRRRILPRLDAPIQETHNATGTGAATNADATRWDHAARGTFTLMLRLRAMTNRSFIFGFLLCLLSIPGFAATMPSVRMKVVDAEDGTPIAGAHVLFQANAHEGTFTGHGGRSANLFVVEAVTDHSGEIQLPKQEFSAYPFFLNTNYHNPTMVVFKPGYVLLILTNTLRIIPKLDEVTMWQYDNQTVKMKRATNDKDMYDALDWAAIYAEMSATEKNICFWKKIPRFLVAVDRSTAEGDRKRATLADAGARNKGVTSTLRKILMNDQFYAEKHCGSPKAFFESYLR